MRPNFLKIVEVAAETMLFEIFHITNARSHRVQVDIVNQTWQRPVRFDYQGLVTSLTEHRVRRWRSPLKEGELSGCFSGN